MTPMKPLRARIRNTARSISPALKLPIQTLRRIPEERRPDRTSARVLLAALAFLAASVLALDLNWRIAIPILVVAGIVGVLTINHVVSSGEIIDQDADAFQRMLLETPCTAIDDEWARLTQRMRALAQAAAIPALHRLKARTVSLATSPRPLIETITRRASH